MIKQVIMESDFYSPIKAIYEFNSSPKEWEIIFHKCCQYYNFRITLDNHSYIFFLNNSDYLSWLKLLSIR